MMLPYSVPNLPHVAYNVRQDPIYGTIWIDFTCYHCGDVARHACSNPKRVSVRIADYARWHVHG